MKWSIIITALVAGASAGTLHGRKNKGNANNGASTGSTNTAVTGAVQKGTSTLVLKETNGVPGNECLTFRNNGKSHRLHSLYLVYLEESRWTLVLTTVSLISGEIVDAACVNTAADRQMTPSTLNGQDVLLVQRTFTADFRSDLVNTQACVGFNGTTFLAQDCSTATDLVSLKNNELVSASGACQSGHDSAAQITVDSSGTDCTTVSTTTVTPTTS